MSNTLHNQRIAKNTLILYLRMIFTLAVSLYTSRVVLDALGVVDFGIFNVVAGVVVLFGFLNNAMAVSTERFLIFELGKGDFKKLKQVFSLSIQIHLIIAAIVLLIAETVGLWFLNTQLNIPSERMAAARWAYHFSIFTAIVNIVTVPYNALIIAHERMTVFAYVSMIDVVLKLLIVYLLVFFGFDKLVFYSVLLFSVTFILRLIYSLYCTRQFQESRFVFYWDSRMFREMSGFAGWNLLGVFAGMGYTQGVNIILNVFFGPIVNAARGISFQVMGAINQLITNFQIAINPPIIKSYAEENKKRTLGIVFSSSKFSFYLLLLFIVPLIIKTDYVLSIWLKEVPEYTVNFTRLVLLDVLIGSLSGPLQILAQATGRVKKYQLVVSIILLLNLPVSYLLLKMGYIPESTFIVSIVLSFLALFARLFVLQQLTQFPVKEFLEKVVLMVVLVLITVTPIPFLIKGMVENQFLDFLIVCVASVLSFFVGVWFIGLSGAEQRSIKSFFLQKIAKQRNN